MSKHLVEICALVIEDIYGPFLAHVFRSLAVSGRLTLIHLAHACHLPIRKLRSALAVLIQSRLLYHHDSQDGRTYYQVNLKSAYSLVRSGKLIEYVRRRWGNSSALIVIILCQDGCMNVLDLWKTWRMHNQRTNDVHGSSFNSNTDGHAHFSYDECPGQTNFSTSLHTLARHGVIFHFKSAHMRHPADLRIDVEDHMAALEKLSGSKAKRTQEETNMKIEAEIEARTTKDFDATRLEENFKSVLKRTAQEDDDNLPHRKGSKPTNGGGASSWSEIDFDETGHATRTEDNLILAVNQDYVVHEIRNRRLRNLVKKRFGSLTANIYASILSQIHMAWQNESISEEPHPEVDDRGNEMKQVDLDDLLMGINTSTLEHENKTVTEGDFDREPRSTIEDLVGGSTLDECRILNGYANGDTSMERMEPVTSDEVERHLNILSQDPRRLVYKGGAGAWEVDLKQLSVEMRREEVMQFVRCRFSGLALRIIRILIDKGKLDEKHLQEIALLPARELRQCLAKLKTAGFLEVQEVPREPQRQASRTIYLWYFDPDRARQVLLSDVYKAMVRLLQMRKIEQQRVGIVLDKAERTDVRGRERDLLSKAENQALMNWRQRERWLLCELGRLDGVVAVLRDA